jgi:thymidylate kinase
MVKNKIEITIKGLTNTGKSAVLLLIKEALEEKGINVEVKESELKELNGDQLAHFKLMQGARLDAISRKSYIELSEMQCNASIKTT